MRSALSLLAPILMPTMPRARAARRLRAAAAMPSLLKPMRLITAPSSASRNRRGRGLPACGRGVTVPHSTKPKPNLRHRVGHLRHSCRSPPPGRPDWENPARKPSPPGADRPARARAAAGPPARASVRVARCAVSAGSCRSSPAPRSNHHATCTASLWTGNVLPSIIGI